MKIPRLLSRLTLGLFFILACAAHAADTAATPVAKKNGYTVVVDIKVNEKGETESVAVHSTEDTSAGEILTKMALAMAQTTKIPVQMKNGVPVRATIRAPFFFEIEDDEGEASNNGPKPKVKDAVQPAYPLELREKGVVGGAILELVVDADGKLTRLTTLRASHPEFAAAATDSIKKWVFTPAMQDGKPVESRTRVAITFDTMHSMADVKWRIAPRPRLGSFVVTKPDHPLEDPNAPAAATTPAPAAEQPAPTPAK